jgi:hypothetical protein
MSIRSFAIYSERSNIAMMEFDTELELVSLHNRERLWWEGLYPGDGCRSCPSAKYYRAQNGPNRLCTHIYEAHFDDSFNGSDLKFEKDWDMPHFIFSPKINAELGDYHITTLD